LLEEIRILSDSDGRERQLQVVLVGQLELRQKLKLPEMRQLDQRLSVHCNLEPLGSDGVAGYVAHRLEIAGGSPDRVRFSAEAIDAVYRASGGVPRLVNRICDRALYQGYLSRADSIDRSIVEGLVSDADPVAPAPAPSPVPEALPTSPVIFSVADFSLPQEHHDAVSEWLTAGENAQGPTMAERMRPLPPAEDVAGPAGSMPTTAADDRKRAAVRPEFVPRTHLQRTTSRWRRRLAMAALWFMVLAGGAIGAGAVWTLSAEFATPVVLPVPPPELPLLMPPALHIPQLPENLLSDGPAADENVTGIETPR